MAEFFNPFEEDNTEIKQAIRNDLGITEPEDIDFAEVVEEFSASKTLDKGTVKFDRVIAGKIKEADKQKELLKEQQGAVRRTYDTLFDSLNERFGLDLHVGDGNLATTIAAITNPVQRKAMEIYLGEAYSRFRVILYMRYLEAISLLSEQILDPQYILSDAMTYSDKLDMLQRLYEFLAKANEIYEQVKVDDADLKLEKLGNEAQDQVAGAPKTNVNSEANRLLLEKLRQSM